MNDKTLTKTAATMPERKNIAIQVEMMLSVPENWTNDEARAYIGNSILGVEHIGDKMTLTGDPRNCLVLIDDEIASAMNSAAQPGEVGLREAVTKYLHAYRKGSTLDRHEALHGMEEALSSSAGERE